MKTKYEVKFIKKENIYVLYKNVVSDHAFGCFKMFEGSKLECQKKKKELLNEGE